jgi:hypothetical protein
MLGEFEKEIVKKQRSGALRIYVVEDHRNTIQNFSGVHSA